MKRLALVAGLLLVFATACHKNQQEADVYQSSLVDSYELKIATVDGHNALEGPYVTGCPNVRFGGEVFCCPEYVTWSNTANGQSGTGAATKYCFDVWDPLFGAGQLCSVTWSVSVPLTTGSNVISLGAAAGNRTASKTVTVEMDPGMTCTVASSLLDPDRDGIPDEQDSCPYDPDPDAAC